MIKALILLYIAFILVSIAYFLYKIDEIKLLINIKITEKGFKKINDDNRWLYYDGLIKLINPLALIKYTNRLLSDDDFLDSIVDELLVSGNYESTDENISMFEEESNKENTDFSIFTLEKKEEFEITPYKAKKLNITEFSELNVINNTNINQNQTVSKIENNNENETKNLSSQLAKYICSMSKEDLVKLSDKIDELIYKY